MNVDPLASMRCWSIEVQLGGKVYEIPALPAVDWWPVLLSGNTSSVFDLLRSDPDDDLDEMILAGDITAEDLNAVFTDAIEEATGRSFHASVVLAAVAASSWMAVNGQLVRNGFRWDVQPIAAALDAIYAIAMESLPDKSDDGKHKPREDFLKLLENPTGKINRDKAAADFETVAGPRPTTGVRSSGARSGSARPRTRQRPRLPRQVAP